MARGEVSYNTHRHGKRKFTPQEEVSHPASTDESPLHPPTNEERLSERPQEEPLRTEAFSLIRDDERRRRTIVEVLRKSQPYKNLARRLLDKKGQHNEQDVNSVIKYVYGIDYNQPRILFDEKINDDNKWKRTNVGHIIDDRLYSYQPREPQKISHRNHNNENNWQGIISNSGDRGEQGISRPSKEKYGYLPQFHEGVDSSLPGFYGNSEDIEGYLVGGKRKLQEIHRELNSYSVSKSLSESTDKDNGFSETHDDDIDGAVFSSDRSPQRKKLFTLWDVDIYEENITKSSEDLESSKGKRFVR